jgi:sirohydrochlorin ferrochelatase
MLAEVFKAHSASASNGVIVLGEDFPDFFGELVEKSVIVVVVPLFLANGLHVLVDGVNDFLELF